MPAIYAAVVNVIHVRGGSSEFLSAMPRETQQSIYRLASARSDLPVDFAKGTGARTTSFCSKIFAPGNPIVELAERIPCPCASNEGFRKVPRSALCTEYPRGPRRDALV